MGLISNRDKLKLLKKKHNKHKETLIAQIYQRLFSSQILSWILSFVVALVCLWLVYALSELFS
jgi:hypothetical protein